MLRNSRAGWAPYHPFLISIFALASSLVFSACADEPVQESIARVQGGPPTIRDVDVTLRYAVELVAAEQVSVAPVAVSGFLTNVFVDVGDKVEAGQVLATLDCREYAAQGAQVAKTISQRQAQVEETKSLLDRMLLMEKDNLIAPAEVDRARAAYRVAEAQLAEARARLSEVSQRQGYCSLKAPFDGYVAARYLDPGAMVGPGEKPVISLVRTNDVTVLASLIEKDAVKVVKDMPVSIMLHAFPERRFAGTIARIGRAIERISRTLPIEIDIPNASDLFLPGMTGRVEIAIETHKDAVLLPITALLHLERASYAFIAEPDEEGKLRARRVEVKLGEDLGDWIEIVEGVSATDQVVLIGRELVSEGKRVELAPPTTLPELPQKLEAIDPSAPQTDEEAAADAEATGQPPAQEVSNELSAEDAAADEPVPAAPTSHSSAAQTKKKPPSDAPKKTSANRSGSGKAASTSSNARGEKATGDEG